MSNVKKAIVVNKPVENVRLSPTQAPAKQSTQRSVKTTSQQTPKPPPKVNPAVQSAIKRNPIKVQAKTKSPSPVRPKNKMGSSRTGKKKLEEFKKLQSEAKAVHLSRMPKQQILQTVSALGEGDKCMEEVIMHFCAPGTLPPVRYAAVVSETSTAIAAVFNKIDANFGQGGGSSPQLPTGTVLAAFFRSISRAAIIYDENGAGAASQYQGLICPPTGGAPQNNVIITDLVTDADFPLVIPYWTPTGPYQPHGNFLPAGAVEGSNSRYVWCDLGDEVELDLSGPNGNVLVVLIDYYGPDGSRLNYAHAGINCNGLSQAITLKNQGTDPAGYYGFRLQQTTDVTGNGGPYSISSILINGTGSHFCHLTTPYYSENSLSVDGARITAVSGMYSNNASMLELGGTIAMVQAGKDKGWMDYISNPVSQIQKSAGSSTINMKDGMYGFLKPTEDANFDFNLDFDFDDNGDIVDSYYSIDRPGAFLLMAARCPQPEGCSGIFTLVQSVEYLTLDPWRELEEPSCNWLVYANAEQKVGLMTQFHENPLHLSDLFAEVKKKKKSILKGALKVAKVAEMVAPVLGAFL